MLERELAKYPFRKESAALVDSLNLQLNELAETSYSKVLDRAVQRITQAIEEGVVDSRLEDYMTELLSFPVAVMLVNIKGEPFLSRRYALAEAVRIYFLLKDEDALQLKSIVKDEFGWDIYDSNDSYDGISYRFTLHFVDYLSGSVGFHEDKWKLVNRIVKGGYVLLTQNETARLIQGEVENLIIERLQRRISINLPEALKLKLDTVVKVFEINRARLGGSDLHSEVISDAFPPCIKYCLEGLLSGRRMSHMERFALTSFLITVGMPLDRLVELFISVSDFDAALTKYQVEHIAGVRGNRTKYTPPHCDTLRTHSICRNRDNICTRIKHPLSYYRTKARRINLESTSEPQLSNTSRRSN